MHRENLLHYGSQYRACSPTVQTYISEKKKWISLIRDVDNKISVLYCTYVPDLQRPNLPILGTYLHVFFEPNWGRYVHRQVLRSRVVQDLFAYTLRHTELDVWRLRKWILPSAD